MDIYHGWRHRRAGPHAFAGRCPAHRDEKPSLVIWQDGHFHCFSLGCGLHGTDVIGAIHAFESLDWREAYNRAEEVLGIRIDRREKRPQLLPAKHTITPLPEQQQMLAHLRDWSHTQLFSSSGEKGRDYLTQRGIDPEKLREFPQVGYISSGGEALSLIEELRADFGEVWRNLAFSLGLLRENGAMRLRDRILCFCEDASGQVIYYQGRKTTDLETDRRYKYLNPPLLDKVPFTLPLPTPRVDGIALVEGVFEVLALAQFRVRALASLGAATLADELVLGLPEPVLLCYNHDHLTDVRGELRRPGEVMAEKVKRQCQILGKQACRVRPPLEYKDMDRWLLKEGIDPFLTEQQIATRKGARVA